MIRSLHLAQTSHPFFPGTRKRAKERNHPLSPGTGDSARETNHPLSPGTRERARENHHSLSPGTGERARERGRRGTLLPRLFALALALALAAPVHASGDPTPRLIALDVGEGQAILLASGKHGMLIDTGRVGMGRHVLNRLRHHGVDHLDAVVYTHLHPDHAGSWFRIHEAFPEVTAIESGHRRPDTSWPGISRWVANALDALPEAQHRVVRQGDRWQWRGLDIRVLWPPGKPEGSLNAQSLVLDIAAGNTRVLVMGDVGTEVERILLERNAIPAGVDLLVAGHHGSKQTSSTELLGQASPAVAVISTDEANIRGYPAASTVERLRRHSDILVRTWLDGERCFLLRHQDGYLERCRADR